MKKTYLIILILFTLTGGKILAQQQYSIAQYNQIRAAINPGFTGVENSTDLKFGYRHQWVQFDQAPINYFVSANGFIGAKNYDSTNRGSGKLKFLKHGIGGYLSQSKQGPSSLTSGFLSYASHIPLNQSYAMALGVSTEIVNNRVKGNEYKPREYDDQTYLALISNDSRNTLNINAGFTVYSDKFYLGYSASQLASTRLSSSVPGDHYSYKIHHHFMTGYTFQLNPESELLTGLLVHYFQPLKPNAMIDAKVRYKKFVWAGLSYRSNKSAVANFGIQTKQKFTLAYAFDYNFNSIRNYNIGTHEIILGYLFK